MLFKKYIRLINVDYEDYDELDKQHYILMGIAAFLLSEEEWRYARFGIHVADDLCRNDIDFIIEEASRFGLQLEITSRY